MQILWSVLWGHQKSQTSSYVPQAKKKIESLRQNKSNIVENSFFFFLLFAIGFTSYSDLWSRTIHKAMQACGPGSGNATLLAHQWMNRVVLTLADQILVKAAHDNRIGVKQWGAAATCHTSAKRLISHPCIMSVYDLHLTATHSWPWIRDPPWLWPWQKK